MAFRRNFGDCGAPNQKTRPFPPLRGRGLGVEGVYPHPFPFTLTLRPSKDEDAPRTIRQCVRVWIPAFAGNAEEKTSKALTQPSPTGRGREPISPRPLGGEGGVRGMVPRLRGEHGCSGIKDQTACKPGSVPPTLRQTRRSFLWTGHCWTVLATYPDASGR